MPWLRGEALKTKLRHALSVEFGPGGLGLLCPPERYGQSFWLIPGATGRMESLQAAVRRWSKGSPLWTALRRKWSAALEMLELMDFRPWYGVLRMEFYGGRQTHQDLDIGPVQFQEVSMLLGLLNQAFLPMRTRTDLRPHLLYDDSAFQDVRLCQSLAQEGYHMAFTPQGKPAGAILITDILDDIAVAPSCQGKGYGKAMVQYGVNRLLAQGLLPSLYVIDTNPAVALYRKLGFQVAEQYLVLKRCRLSQISEV